MVNTIDVLSPIKSKEPILSVRNRGAKAVINEAKLISLKPNITGQQLRNSTTLEISRFIDKRLTDVAKSQRRNYNSQTGCNDLDEIADD